ncbi:hypothetical protein SUGI_0015760 [Cryptomeria japonica]|nr:hypothetical protein SUGI_0015760 [Cryptomeria japonica]
MAGAAQNSIYALLLGVIMMVFMISSVLAAEADAPSPSPITGAAYLAGAPSLALGFVGSLIAFLACFFH